MPYHHPENVLWFAHSSMEFYLQGQRDTSVIWIASYDMVPHVGAKTNIEKYHKDLE